MNKDTIYIDVEDDITAIIGKVKGSKSKVVALVPPKRIGVLQSAVNLRLLARAAKQSKKHLVLISGNSALTALAASAGIASARTLQSKPQLPTPPAAAENNADEDIINGADLPVGDLARTSEDSVDAEKTALASPVVDSVIRSNTVKESTSPFSAAAKRTSPVAAARSKVKVPNFDTFRKKMALGVTAGVLLIGFLVWAIWFAPHANIIITARTIDASSNPKVTLVPAGDTNADASTLKVISQKLEKEVTLSFEATGTKEVGDKATGQVVFHNCESPNSITVPAGTGISAGGKTYITQASATVPGGQGNFWTGSCNAGKSSGVAVVAQDIGEDFNADEGTRFSVAGHANSSSDRYFRAVASTAIDGGSRKEITVVSQADVDSAIEQLTKENTDGMKSQLAEAFSGDIAPIEATFSVSQGEVASSPAVDQEAKDGKANLTGALVYTMLGIDKKEKGTFLSAYFEKQLEDESNQRVYDNGADKASFMDVRPAENGAYTATMTATAKFGPKIDDAAVKSGARGKRYGDVQSSLEQISGVESVDVKFSPFWVKTVPDDENRISIEFKLNDAE